MNPEIELRTDAAFYCYGCGKHISPLVYVGEDDGSACGEERYALLCFLCIKKAMDVLICPVCNSGASCEEHQPKPRL